VYARTHARLRQFCMNGADVLKQISSGSIEGGLGLDCFQVHPG